MHTEDMLKKAAAFAGYTEAGFDDMEVFCVVEKPNIWKPWNPLGTPADNEELIAKLQADNHLYMSQGNHGRIDVYGSHYDIGGAVSAQLAITELYKNHNENHNENMHQAKRMAITKLAATLYDLRGVS